MFLPKYLYHLLLKDSTYNIGASKYVDKKQ